MLNRLPNPRGETRRKLARERRIAAAEAAHARGQPPQPVNGELVKYDGKWPTNFSKGLPHDKKTGLVAPRAFKDFVRAINDANNPDEVYSFDVAIGPLDASTKHPGQPERDQNGHRPDSYSDRPGDPKQFSLEFKDVKNDPTKVVKVRNWESPRAGHVYDLEGPDAGALAISSFPKLGSHELNAEIAELYAMAYLRDVSVIELEENGGNDTKVVEVLTALNKLPWFSGNVGKLTEEETRRREARHKELLLTGASPTQLNRQTLFRGSAPGAKVGPFASQFLLIGNKGKQDPGGQPLASQVSSNPAQLTVLNVTAEGNTFAPAGIEKGYILWGAQQINQRLAVHKEEINYLGDWPAWLDVQNGADFRKLDLYWEDGRPRFITTLRDLATYVHFDALYQAYLNAYLLLGGFEARFEVGVPSGQNHPTRGSFATFGPPHFQTLLTEVASRALKAVRRQKFNWQLRGRPEYLAAMLSVAASDPAELGPAQADAVQTLNALDDAGVFSFSAHIHSQLPDTLVPRDGVEQPTGPSTLHLLPQAFPEGSPMHPSYGAGHATVAGACVTILKAVFQTYVDPRLYPKRNPLDPTMYEAPDFTQPEWWREDKRLTLDQIGLDLDEDGNPLPGQKPKLEFIYRPPALESGFKPPKKDELKKAGGANQLTLIGEFNKLAANIAIARNIAGVHYYIDYYASLRLGERVAAGILEEQLLTYPEPVSFRFESFDGDRVVLRGTGDGQTIERYVYDTTRKSEVTYQEWWKRHFED